MLRAIFNLVDSKELMKRNYPKMPELGFAVVGTGFIAGVIAEAITKSKSAKLVAVSSRRLENAQNWVAKYPGAAAVERF